MKMFPVTLTKHGLSSTDDLAYEGRNINNHQRRGEHPITSVFSFRNLPQQDTLTSNSPSYKSTEK